MSNFRAIRTLVEVGIAVAVGAVTSTVFFKKENRVIVNIDDNDNVSVDTDTDDATTTDKDVESAI